MSAVTATSSTSKHTVATAVAPLIALSATWVARKALINVYESATGRPAPVIHNRQASIRSRVLWSATMSATVTVIEILVWRMLDDSQD